MFEKWKRKRLENKIFVSQGHKDYFLRQAAFAKIEGIVRHLNRMRQAIHDQDRSELGRRQKFLQFYGIKPPKSVNQCNQLIEDLRKWREE